ncbi:hypothetical protein GCM10023321_06600 [Pseudonocardia eucalypti]|uniref:Mce-associated membrane protein n=2 Tax=Pseudonocardia eucalypti TaxID=648755 RepID=A0ABP9PNY9_9PSEU
MWTRVAAVAAGLGLVGAVALGVFWWNAGHGSTAQAAQARGVALDAAGRIAVNLQTLDAGAVEQGLTAWEDSATGALLEEFQRNRKRYAEDLRKAQSSTTARLVNAAIADLDAPNGRATAIASVDVTRTSSANGAPKTPVTKRIRVQMELVRVSDTVWKADAAGPVPS